MFFKKNKYKKLKREDVVSSILQLQAQESALEEGFASKQNEIDRLLDKGKRETDRSLKIFYAKKINMLKAERATDMNRAMYIMYNLQLLGKLKDALDDKDFIASVGDVPMNKLLSDQKGLANFLNQALNNKIMAEDIMTGADEIFADIQSAYQPNSDIYGINKGDDDLLAVFEIAEGLGDESHVQNGGEKIREEQSNGID